jgi:hypothetical protein
MSFNMCIEILLFSEFSFTIFELTFKTSGTFLISFKLHIRYNFQWWWFFAFIVWCGVLSKKNCEKQICGKLIVLTSSLTSTALSCLIWWSSKCSIFVNFWSQASCRGNFSTDLDFILIDWPTNGFLDVRILFEYLVDSTPCGSVTFFIGDFGSIFCSMWELSSVSLSHDSLKLSI